MTLQRPTGLEPGDFSAESAQGPAVPSRASPAAPPRTDKRRWSSSDLLGAEKEVEIEHGGMVYRLRQTALGKLILTK